MPEPSGSIRGTTARAIASSVESAIDRGELAPGDVLPSVRALAADLGVSPMTVMGAFRDLRARGVVTTHERRRTRVASRPPIARRSTIPFGERLADVASDNPDSELLPDLDAALARIDRAKQLYGGQTVLARLRELAQAQFAEIGVAGDVGVVNGTFDAVERALQTASKPGDPVAVEDPGYTGVLDLVRTLGLVPVGVAVDEHGMLPDSLDAVLRGGAVAAVYTPRAQNPRGAAFDDARAADLRAVLRRRREVLLVEDDHAGPVTEEPYHTLTGDRDRWIVIRSVSKSLGPDLRLAAIAADRTTLGRVEGRQLLTTGWVSYVVQRLVVALWEDRRVRAQLRRAAKLYGKRRRGLIAALAERGVAASGRSGLNVWVPVPEEATAARNMFALGWAVTSGEPYRLDSPPGLRITTAAVPLERIDELARDIAQALAPERRTSRA